MKIFGKDVKGLSAHFMGVGGIGMSGLAEVLREQGAAVSGSDSGTKANLARLEEMGIGIARQQAATNLRKDMDLVVVSSAIRPDNPELVEAKALGLKIVHRAEVLAEIMANYQSVAVSGTHGKTSTTALIYSVLRAAGLPVGVINGGILQELGTNAVLPPKAGDWLVVEADESDASFLKLKPQVAVITNIEPEHMDTYGSEEKLVQAFIDFADSAQVAVLCADDPNVMLVEARTSADVMSYGLEDGADVYASMYAPQGGGMAFDASIRGGVLDDVVVALPGAHYVLNSLAALAVASVLKADVAKAAAGLATFKGVGRRFTKVGTFNGADVIDDYGHHPTEIAAVLDAAKSVYAGKVVAVIQPHRYTRLRDLMEEFAGCAKVADAAVILPVYSAGEDAIEGVSHTMLAGKMAARGLPAQVRAVDGEEDMVAALEDLGLGAGDVVVCLGAGTITDYAKHLAERG